MHTANVANMYSQSSYYFKVTGDFNDKITVKSTALLTDVLCSSNMGGLQITDRFPITPDTIPSTRLHALCRLYYNYIFKKIKLKYRTRQPTTRDGQVGMFFYDDPGEIITDSPISGYLLESMILEGQQGVLNPVYSNFTMDYHGKSFRPYYRCSAQGSEIQDTVQTNLCIAVQRPEVVENQNSMGLIEIEYELEFSKPKSSRPVADGMLIPGYPFIIGPGNFGQQNVDRVASWEISNTTPHGTNYFDFASSSGIYMLTSNIQPNSGSVNPTASWDVTINQGTTLFMKAEYLSSISRVRFTMYADYGSVIADIPLRTYGDWTTYSGLFNIHRIQRFFDVSNVAGLPDPDSMRKQVPDKVVQPETVSNVINQRVFVDPKYIETISTQGQSRNLSSYL